MSSYPKPDANAGPGCPVLQCSSTPVTKAPDLSVLLAPAPRELVWTVWPAAKPHQPHVAHGGECVTGNWTQLCRWVEQEHRDGPVHAKGRGPQWSPVANIDGHRCIESTTAMFALTLDCDGAGDWAILLAALDAARVAYLAYRSSGHTPETPKWRIVLLLARPYVTQGDPVKANQEWHRLYEFARIWIGALAGFSDPANDGFDQATSSIANVFYLGHRRAPDVPVREVRWSKGLALDGAALLAMAPAAHSAGRASRSAGHRQQGHEVTGLQVFGFDVDLGTGIFEPDTLDGDTEITLTNDGVTVGPIKLRNVKSRSHCLCPVHVGSGGGSAWVDRTSKGVRLWCVRCKKTWHSHTAVKPINPATLAEIKAAEAAADAADTHLQGVRKVVARLEKDHQKTLSKRRSAEGCPPPAEIIELARKADEAAKELAEVIRAEWRAAGYNLRGARCGTLPQGLGCAATGRARLVARPCHRVRCIFCGPLQVARQVTATTTLPALDANRQVIGLALKDRKTWMYSMPTKQEPSWLRGWRRAAVRFQVPTGVTGSTTVSTPNSDPKTSMISNSAALGTTPLSNTVPCSAQRGHDNTLASDPVESGVGQPPSIVEVLDALALASVPDPVEPADEHDPDVYELPVPLPLCPGNPTEDTYVLVRLGSETHVLTSVELPGGVPCDTPVATVTAWLRQAYAVEPDPAGILSQPAMAHVRASKAISTDSRVLLALQDHRWVVEATDVCHPSRAAKVRPKSKAQVAPDGLTMSVDLGVVPLPERDAMWAALRRVPDDQVQGTPAPEAQQGLPDDFRDPFDDEPVIPTTYKVVGSGVRLPAEVEAKPEFAELLLYLQALPEVKPGDRLSYIESLDPDHVLACIIDLAFIGNESDPTFVEECVRLELRAGNYDEARRTVRAWNSRRAA
jgi:hypothetical protein